MTQKYDKVEDDTNDTTLSFLLIQCNTIEKLIQE